MKTTEPKSSTSSVLQRKSDTTPFFQQEGSREAFFGSKQADAPFFRPEQNNPGPERSSTVHRPSSTVQAKLKIGAPDDHFEREADATADKVVQRLAETSTGNGAGLEPSTVHHLPSTVQLKCAECEQEEQVQKEDELSASDEQVQMKPIFDSAAEPPPGTPPLGGGEGGGISGGGGDDEIRRKPIFNSEQEGVQRKCADCEAEGKEEVQKSSDEGASGASEASPDVASRLQSSKGGGSHLPDDARSSMESAFGADFSGVRVHTGSEAAGLSQDLSAQAFTIGRDIYFNEGKYDPGSTEGKKLLAHELTHTVQQGAAIRKKPVATLAAAPRIQRSWLSEGAEWVKNKIKQGLNWAAERVIPGYSLLNVILGKNLITDEPVERSGINIVRAYMRLIPVVGSILLSELEESETLTQAGVWTEEQVAKFGINFDDIAKRLTAMWDEMSVWRGIDYNVEIFQRYIGPVLGKFLAFSGVMEQKMKELRFEGALKLVGATELLTAIRNSPAAFRRMVDNPGEILSHFMDALKKGFSNFKDNFFTHFKNALFGWLLGQVASSGIRLPKEVSIGGMFSIIAQLAGLTYAQIKATVINKLGSKYGPKAAKVFAAIEKGVEVVMRVINMIKEGPIALWNLLEEHLTNLKDMVISQVSQLVSMEIIKSAVMKLVSMLNPAGALLQIVLTLYRVVKFFIDNWDTIKDIATGIISSVAKVALGQIGDAIGFIENILGKGIKLIISFLARILGLGDLAEKVKKLLKKIGGILIAARDKAIEWLVKKGTELYEKLFKRGGDKDDKKKGGLEGVKEEINSEGKEKEKDDGEIKKEEAEQIAEKVRADQADVIESISVKDGGETWKFDFVQRTEVEIPKVKIFNQGDLIIDKIKDKYYKVKSINFDIGQVLLVPFNSTESEVTLSISKIQNEINEGNWAKIAPGESAPIKIGNIIKAPFKSGSYLAKVMEPYAQGLVTYKFLGQNGVFSKRSKDFAEMLSRQEVEIINVNRDFLRSHTPSPEIRSWAESQLSEGDIDPAFPSLTVLGTPAADHIIPFSKILQMPNFDLLTQDQQIIIVNLEDNFVAMSSVANNSKGTKSFKDWVKSEKLGLYVDPVFRRKMMEREAKAEKALQSAINKFVSGQTL